MGADTALSGGVKDTMFHHHQDQREQRTKPKHHASLQCLCGTKHSAREAQRDRVRTWGSLALSRGQAVCLDKGKEDRQETAPLKLFLRPTPAPRPA